MGVLCSFILADLGQNPAFWESASVLLRSGLVWIVLIHNLMCASVVLLVRSHYNAILCVLLGFNGGMLPDRGAEPLRIELNFESFVFFT